MDIRQSADGRPVYRATYCLDRDGSWLICAETESGEAHVSAGRLIDIERRGYEAVRRLTGREMCTFDVTFTHQLDLDVDDERSLSA